MPSISLQESCAWHYGDAAVLYNSGAVGLLASRSLGADQGEFPTLALRITCQVYTMHSCFDVRMVAEVVLAAVQPLTPKAEIQVSFGR